MTPEEIRAIPVFWSLRRRRYWNQCRLRYFLHYYASALGKRECDDPLCVEARELDRCISVQAVVRIVITHALHAMFARGSCRTVADEAEEHFRKKVSLMKQYPDTARYIVPELLNGDTDVLDRVAREVRQAGEKVEENFWSSIKYLPSGFRRTVDRPQKVQLMELACYFVPVLAFSFHGDIWILESSAVNEEGNLLACLHRMWVYNELGHDPSRVRSVYLDDSYQIRQVDDLPSISAALREILKDLDDMLAADMEGYAYLPDFPPTPGPVCASCQFRPYCLKNKFLSRD